MKQRTAVIGSGIAGIASAIRMAARGYDVVVFEQGPIAGGKLSERRHNGFRFDTGPSLFTLPEMVTSLFTLCGKNPGDYFSYHLLDSSCKYFWEDGTRLVAWQDPARFSEEVERQTGVPVSRITAFLKKSRRLYDLTSEVFLFNSIHRISNLALPSYRRSLVHLHELDVWTTMHKKNSRWFRDPKIVQLFDRYATYNGSDPYRTPATLNIIPHLEHNTGAFFPEKGMYQIVDALTRLASDMGVQFLFNTPAEEIITKGKRAVALRAAGTTIPFDLIVSDADVVTLYKKLLPRHPFPKRQLSVERSTSALIFYWGVSGSFPELSLHNILFSNDYKKEFDHLFTHKSIAADPTVYIFISAREVPSDAPGGHENWYVMINAPENNGQDWEAMISMARSGIIDKINRMLGISIDRHIVTESVADPRTIEADTGSYRGSLYGPSSNNKFSAFYRHANFIKSIKNIYFTGGSVHPGGGIPLCLASAMIVDKEISKTNNINH